MGADVSRDGSDEEQHEADRGGHAERGHTDTDQQTERARDTWEVDNDLQARCAAVYDGLAERHWLSPWQVVVDPDFDALAALVVT